MTNTLSNISFDIFQHKIIYYIIDYNINSIDYNHYITNTSSYKFDIITNIKSEQYNLIKNVWYILDLICSCKFPKFKIIFFLILLLGTLAMDKIFIFSVFL